MANFKVKNGLQAGRYLLSGGTETAGSEGYYLAGASYDSVSFSVSGQDTLPRRITFNNDGTKMYMLGASNTSVYQYSLSTAFDVSTASYDSVSFNVGGTMSGPFDVTFNSNGTKMYILAFGTDAIYQYTLSTAFDLSTISYDNVSFSVTSQDTTPRGLDFNNDGTKMYVVGDTNNSIYQYSLSTAFDLSTASYDSVSFSVATQDTNPSGIAFNTNGSKMYVVGFASDSVYQYSLTTAFDLSTASYDSVSFSVSGQALIPYSISFNATGSKMFILDNNTKNVLQYSLSTAFNLSTASYDTVSFTITQMSNPVGMAFNTDGTKMYVVGTTNDTVYQYSTATPATITYPSTIEWPGGSAPTSPPIGETDVLTFSTRDGGSTYQGVLAIDGAK